ncbi:MAG TPA: hypothetical protein VIP11_16090 [Gemmatimonadaceae bacterium]
MIHLHAFVFLALAILEVSKFSRLPIVVTIVSIATLIWIPAYSTFAFARVYGGSIKKTLAKEIGISLLYGAVAFAAFILTLDVVSLLG